MVNQRVNFTRNMLVMIPVVCILAMVTVDRLLSWLAARQWPPGAASMALTPAFVLLVAFTPIARSLDFHERISSRPPDSRIDVSRWLAGASRAYSDTAISGELQFPLQEYLARGVTRFAADEMDTVVLFLAGFDRLVVGPEFDSARPDLLLVEQVFPGDQTARPTIPVNPEVRVYRLPHVLIESTAVRSLVEEQPRYAVAPPTYVQGEPDTPDEWTCAPVSESEEWVEPSIEYCWVQSRLARVILDPRAIEVAVGRSRDVGVTLDIMSPWPTQSCVLQLESWTSADLCTGLQPGQWERRSATVPSALLADADALFLTTGRVHTPSSQGLDHDPRRLGLVIRSVELGTASAAAE